MLNHDALDSPGQLHNPGQKRSQLRFITTAEFLPQHRKQLDDTRALIARAEADGHTRLAEMNRTVETNLLTIITTLEADQHDCQCAAAGSETYCRKESSDAP